MSCGLGCVTILRICGHAAAQVLRLAGQFRSKTRLERLKTGATALPKLVPVPKARVHLSFVHLTD